MNREDGSHSKDELANRMVLRNGGGTEAQLISSLNLHGLDDTGQECQTREASTINCPSHHGAVGESKTI